MADRLIIVLAGADPTLPEALVSPLSLATVAAAMEYDVEIVITGRSAALARRGVAQALQLPDGSRSVHALIQEARSAGVAVKVCVPAPGLSDDDLIAEIDETVGAAYLVSEAMDDATVTLTY